MRKETEVEKRNSSEEGNEKRSETSDAEKTVFSVPETPYKIERKKIRKGLSKSERRS